MKQRKNIYVLMYIYHLCMHIYLSLNVDSYIDNAFERVFCVFCRKFIAWIDNYVFRYLAIILCSTFNFIMWNNDRHKKWAHVILKWEIREQDVKQNDAICSAANSASATFRKWKMNVINLVASFSARSTLRAKSAAALPLRFWREIDRAGSPLICRTRRTRNGSAPRRVALRLI